MFACSTFIGYIKLDFLSREHKAAPATSCPMGAIWSKPASVPTEGRSCQSDLLTDEELHVAHYVCRESATQSPEEDRSANAGTSEVVSAALDRSICLELDKAPEEEARKPSVASVLTSMSRPASVWPGPLTAAKLAYDQAVHHASMRLEAEYKANETKLHGITRRTDEQKQLFYSAVFAKHRQRRMEIYATNSLLRERERQRYEAYSHEKKRSALDWFDLDAAQSHGRHVADFVTMGCATSDDLQSTPDASPAGAVGCDDRLLHCAATERTALPQPLPEQIVGGAESQALGGASALSQGVPQVAGPGGRACHAALGEHGSGCHSARHSAAHSLINSKQRLKHSQQDLLPWRLFGAGQMVEEAAADQDAVRAFAEASLTADRLTPSEKFALAVDWARRELNQATIAAASADRARKAYEYEQWNKDRTIALKAVVLQQDLDRGLHARRAWGGPRRPRPPISPSQRSITPSSVMEHFSC